MPERPAVGTTVKTKIGKYSPVYEGMVTKHTDDPVIFRLDVQKVNGEPKRPGSYPIPIMCHIREIIGG